MGAAFFGRYGELRAGWRFLLYVVLVAVLSVAVNTTFRLLRGPPRGTFEFSATHVIVSDSLMFLIVVAPALLLGRVEGRRLGDYGLPPRSAFRLQFWEGMGWGVVLQTAVILVLLGLGVCHISGFALSAAAAMEFGLLWAVAFVLVGLAEEFLLRGYTQFTLTTGIGFWPAGVLLSGAFALLHLPNPGETWVGALGVFLAGMVLVLALRRTGALWLSIGLHAGWNWTQTFLVGAPNSGMVPQGYLLTTSFSGSRWLTGDTVGPEGSVVTLVLLTLAFVLLHFRFPQARYPRRHALKPSIHPS